MENSEKNISSIKNWAEDERPREKMEKHGVDILSNSELLAILISTGSKEKSAIDLAKEVLHLGHNNLDELGRLSLKTLRSINGIGPAKAITIMAALELGRRRNAGSLLSRQKLSTAKETAEFLREILKDYSYEVFAVIFLNRAMKVKSFKIISRGGISGTVADPRIILKNALDEGATSIILSHNHPSGNLNPSRADQEITFKIRQAASYFDIIVTDHIIVSSEGYFSFADNGLMSI